MGDDRFLGGVEAEQCRLSGEDFEDALAGAGIALQGGGSEGGVEFLQAGELDGAVGGSVGCFCVFSDEVRDEFRGAVEFRGNGLVVEALSAEGEGAGGGHRGYIGRWDADKGLCLPKS